MPLFSSRAPVAAIGLLVSTFLCALDAPAGDTGTPLDLVDSSRGVMRNVVERFAEDRRLLERRYSIPGSSRMLERRSAFYRDWSKALAAIDFAALDADDRVDWVLLGNEIRYAASKLEFTRAQDAEIAPLVPFTAAVVALEEARRETRPADARSLASALEELAESVGSVRRALESPAENVPAPSSILAERAAQRVDALTRTLASWHRFYDSYDPLFSWWTKRPYSRARGALTGYALFLRERLAGTDDRDRIVGDPIGRQALRAELDHELIAYSPEELFAIAEREFDWCDREMLRASEDLGFADDWKRALDHVKNLHVSPGEQPKLIRELADEAVRFLEERDLLTIPSLAKESWRVEMMSAERQRVNPYFTGGEIISVSFPTDEMEHAEKLMSLRGNNIHFSRATVHHELIPGHHLQGFMQARYRPYRRTFRTPFWVEGWALYWEMRLWDLGFARSAEDRVGMLFWRRHRCARIIFSLSYHLGTMTAEECVEFLVDRVGHERRNATAEVRRSVIGGYSPLYQCAYMLGGLQLRSLHAELVENGPLTEKQFHDRVLRENAIPIALIRARLGNVDVAQDFDAAWSF